MVETAAECASAEFRRSPRRESRRFRNARRPVQAGQEHHEGLRRCSGRRSGERGWPRRPSALCWIEMSKRAGRRSRPRWPKSAMATRCASSARSTSRSIRFFTDVLVMADDPRAARGASGAAQELIATPVLRPAATFPRSLRKKRSGLSAGHHVSESATRSMNVEESRVARKNDDRERAEVFQQAREVCLFLRARQGRRQSHHEGPARRQRLGPCRDDERGPAGPARIHDLDRGLQHLLPGEGEDSRRDRSRDRRTGQEARKGRRRDAGLDREPAAGLGALGREVLDAGHDGHDPQPRLERRGGRRIEAAHQQRPVCVRQLPPLHPDVRQRRAGDSQGSSSSTSSKRQEGGRREAGHRSRRAGAAGRRRALQRRHPEGGRQVVSAGSARPAQDVARCGLPILDESARHRVPAHLRYPRSYRHRRQRSDDGVRQHRRSLGDRRRIHAQSGDGREGVLRRVPHQRPGRGRRVRRPHAAADSRARAGAAQGLQTAARDHDAAGEALQGHSGLRVHHPGRAAVHAADAQRQAHRVCRRRDRDRSRQREADYAERSGAARRPRVAQPAAGARLRSGRVEEDTDRDPGTAGVPRRGQRAGGIFGRRTRSNGSTRASR